jgi:hypothetical protein
MNILNINKSSTMGRFAVNKQIENKNYLFEKHPEDVHSEGFVYICNENKRSHLSSDKK